MQAKQFETCRSKSCSTPLQRSIFLPQLLSSDPLESCLYFPLPSPATTSCNRQKTLTPDILLVLVVTPHALHHRFRLLRADPSFLRDDLPEHDTHLPSHVGGIAADVEVRLLREQLVDQVRVLLQPLLDIDLLTGLFPAEG